MHTLAITHIKYLHVPLPPSLPPSPLSLSLGRFKSHLFCSYAILQCQEFLFRPEKVLMRLPIVLATPTGGTPQILI